jgi:hypothetical protein
MAKQFKTAADYIKEVRRQPVPEGWDPDAHHAGMASFLMLRDRDDYIAELEREVEASRNPPAPKPKESTPEEEALAHVGALIDKAFRK